MKSTKDVLAWMEDLRTAWLSHDISHAINLFSECVEYGEDPFCEPLHDLSQIKQTWLGIENQSDLTLNFQLLAWTGKIATIRWHACFKAEGLLTKQFDGIYVVEFNSTGHCHKFYQWWNERPEV